MELTTLYYPYHPSDGPWLRHALLYYDYVGTTVPALMEPVLAQCELPVYLRELREAGLYRPLTDVVGVRTVLDYLAKKNPAFAHAGVVGAEDVALRTFLDPRFMAEDTARGESFRLVELLAEAVTASASDVVVPSTAERKAFRHLFEDSIPHVEPRLNGLYLTYSGLLPSPRADVPLGKVVAFKNDRRDELRRMRTALSKFRGALSGCEHLEEAKILLLDAQSEIESSLADVRAALDADLLGATGGVLRELVEIKSPFLAALIASVATGAATAQGLNNVPISALIAGASVGGAVTLSTAALSLFKRRRQVLRDTPYAYLYLAQQDGIIERAS